MLAVRPLLLLPLLTLAIATPHVFPRSTPTCPPGPFPAAPDCSGASCMGTSIFGGDGLCKRLCSCSASSSSTTSGGSGTTSGRSGIQTAVCGQTDHTIFCDDAVCEDGQVVSGDARCAQICSCPTVTNNHIPIDFQGTPPSSPSPLPPTQTLDCGNATVAENPALAALAGQAPKVQDWCAKADVNAVCEGSQVVVKGVDTDNVCKPLCRCR